MRESNEIFSALKRLRINPKHALGQNFLVDEDVYTNIISESHITKKTNVLEIGSGIGTLTKHIAQRAAHVVTIEHDQSLVQKLPAELGKHTNITLVPGSYLDIPHKEVVSLFPDAENEFIVVANLPYQITAKTLQRLVTDTPVPKRSIVMVQREVADRVTASPGKLSMLALTVLWYAETKKLFDVRPESFFPIPKVHSSVLYIRPRGKALHTLDKGMTIEDVFSVAKIAFHQKRKTVANSLSGGLGVSEAKIKAALEACKIAQKTRPQELSHKQWISLSVQLKCISKE